MPLHLYPNVYESGSVPDGFPLKAAPSSIRCETGAVRRYLRQLLPGKWEKVIKRGNTGEVHYFEDATRSPRGGSRLRLPDCDRCGQMPRACRIGIYTCFEA